MSTTVLLHQEPPPAAQMKQLRQMKRKAAKKVGGSAAAAAAAEVEPPPATPAKKAPAQHRVYEKATRVIEKPARKRRVRNPDVLPFSMRNGPVNNWARSEAALELDRRMEEAEREASDIHRRLLDRGITPWMTMKVCVRFALFPSAP